MLSSLRWSNKRPDSEPGQFSEVGVKNPEQATSDTTGPFGSDKLLVKLEKSKCLILVGFVATRIVS
jgi:hypothetical protein